MLEPKAWGIYCPRCGEDPNNKRCVHTWIGVIMDAGEAARVRARYAFGKLYNPDHDITSYRDEFYDNPNLDRPSKP